MFEIPAGGRRYQGARTAGEAEASRQDRARPLRRARSRDRFAEDDSLAENIQRAPLHPLDQFRAFQALRERAVRGGHRRRLFVSVNVVKQRLRLAAVSPTLLDIYAEDGMSLEQLDGLHRLRRSCATGAGLGGDCRFLVEGALSDPAHADREERCAPPTSGRCSSGSTSMKRPAASFCATSSAGRRWLARGCALLDSLVADEAEDGSRDRSPPRAGSGSRSRAEFPYGHDHGLRRARRRWRPI